MTTENGGKKAATRDLLRDSLTGHFTEEKRRRVADRVSTTVKDAVGRSIKRRKGALEELAKH